ncbi:membrane protein implicated in regulation of membrane protease activity [Sphingomonas zeicaulis]|uniref:YqiJ family protein n=1 Tax=Sphingomonas zeicaulis TaxID=1632740 RepID=UPI003D1C1D05
MLLEFLGQSENIAFSIALALMVLIGLVEALGLGAASIDLDLDLHLPDAAGPLHWLGVGRVPLMAVLIAFLAAFGLVGLAGQQVALELTGTLFSPLIAIPAAAATALPVTAVASRLLGRVLPQDETTAIDVATLVGRTGQIVVGTARQGAPARARVRDEHGQSHYVLVEPDDAGQALGEGETVLLVRREASLFRAIAYDTPRFSNWTE